MDGRAWKYLSGLLFLQGEELETKSQYNGIQKVVCIWIFPEPPKYFQNIIEPGNTYLPGESDYLRLFKVGLGDPSDSAVSSGLWMLNVIFSDTLSIGQ